MNKKNKEGPLLFEFLVSKLPQYPWNARVEIFKGLVVILTRIGLDILPEDSLKALLQLLRQSLEDKYAVVKSNALAVVEELTSQTSLQKLEPFHEDLKAALEQLSQEDLALKGRSDTVLKRLAEQLRKRVKQE